MVGLHRTSLSPLYIYIIHIGDSEAEKSLEQEVWYRDDIPE